MTLLMRSSNMQKSDRIFLSDLRIRTGRLVRFAKFTSEDAMGSRSEPQKSNCIGNGLDSFAPLGGDHNSDKLGVICILLCSSSVMHPEVPVGSCCTPVPCDSLHSTIAARTPTDVSYYPPTTRWSLSLCAVSLPR